MSPQWINKARLVYQVRSKYEQKNRQTHQKAKYVYSKIKFKQRTQNSYSIVQIKVDKLYTSQESYMELLAVGIEETKLGIPFTVLFKSSAPIFTVLLPINHHHHHHKKNKIHSTRTDSSNSNKTTQTQFVKTPEIPKPQTTSQSRDIKTSAINSPASNSSMSSKPKKPTKTLNHICNQTPKNSSPHLKKEESRDGISLSQLNRHPEAGKIPRTAQTKPYPEGVWR